MDTAGIEAFEAGVRRDSQGRTDSWSKADLDELAAAYNEVASSGKHDAPVLVGHDGNTAHGWVGRAYRQGKKLLLDFKQVAQEFADAANAGRYKKRSISIYPRSHPDNPTPGRLNIRHLAYVGVPAVKGLKDHTFTDSGDGFITFDFEPPNISPSQSGADTSNYMEWSAASAIASIAEILQSQRDKLIESDGVEGADQVFPKYLLDHIVQSAGDRSDEYPSIDEMRRLRERVTDLEIAMQQQFEERADPVSTPSDHTDDVVTDTNEPMDTDDKPKDTETETVATVDPTEFAELSERMKTLESNFAEAQQTITALQDENKVLKEGNTRLSEFNEQLQKQQERERIVNFVERMVRERKILPADKDNQVELLVSIPGHTEYEYGEGEKMSPRTRLMETIESRSPLYSAGEIDLNPATAPEFEERKKAEAQGFDAESDRLHRQVQEYAEKHSCSYEDAMIALEVQT